MLTPDEAAEIAARFGLTVQDAAGLRSLADSAEAAERIAARFAQGSDELQARAVVRRVFGERKPRLHLPNPPEPTP